jgi:hypothetical protein
VANISDDLLVLCDPRAERLPFAWQLHRFHPNRHGRIIGASKGLMLFSQRKGEVVMVERVRPITKPNGSLPNGKVCVDVGTPLSNQRHELFAQALASGMSADAAYMVAGYKRNDGNCIRLKGNERVVKRVEELKRHIAEQALITPIEVMREVGKMARGKPADKLTHKVKLAALQTAGDLLHMGKDDKGQPINITISTIDLRHL